MTNPRGPLAGEGNSIEEGNPFRFVSVHNPSATRDPKSSRLVRSHAVKQGLKAKRKFQEESSGNFRVGFPTRDIKTSPSIDLASLYSSANTHDPFDMLVVDSWRLKSLLGYSSQNAEPIVRVQDDVVLKAFQSVFRTDVDDPALSNAVMLTYSFEVTGGSINQECLGYLNKATKSISERMSSSTTAASVTVIGAILLLAGIEARLGMRPQVQLHIRAIRHLLGVCAKEQVYLNDGIKRAIFWQDLNCSIMTGSSPIFDHTTFAELQWRRDSFLTHIYVLSPGFERRLDLLNEEFVEVLEDLHGLQSIRDCPNFDCYDATDMIRVDNHQASIQSRLAALSATKVSLLSECCHLAAYIFACQLCCKVWRASSIPSHVSLQLLGKLRQADDDDVWDEHPDLLLWLVYTAGAFNSNHSTRLEYTIFLKQKYSSQFGNLYSSWSEVRTVLKQFLWSERAGAVQVREFWEESFI